MTHQILPAVPKRSTSSRCTTGDGGFVPWRTQDAKEHRERMAQVTAPTPTEALIDHNIRVYRERQAADEAAERRRLADMRARIARDEQRLKELKALKERQADYKRRELLLTRLMDSYNLSAIQRAVVNRKLVTSKDATDLVLAEMTIQELLASPQPVEASGDAGLDWRSALKVMEKK